MNRVIEFRAWDGKRMVTPAYSIANNGHLKTCAFAYCKTIGSNPYCDHLYGADSSEVIGNIYENKELIK